MDTVLTILSPLLSELLQIGASALLVLLLWLGKRAADWLKLSNDSKVREYLNQALENAVAWAEAEARKHLPARPPGVPTPALSADDKGRIVTEAAAYVVDRVPGALAHFGITPDGVRQLVQARLSTI